MNEKELPAKVQTKLPTLQELHSDPVQAFKNDQLKQLMYQEPPKQWLKVDKYSNNAVYLPIGKTEYLLDKIFQRWRVEVMDVKQMFNSITVTVRLHYWNVALNEWDFHDGVGAAEVQTKAGSSPADLAAINKGAVAMATPIAKSRAIKDATHHIGRIFGRDLNRQEETVFSGAYSSFTVGMNDLLELYNLKSDTLSKEDIAFCERVIANNEKASFTKMYNLLMSA